MSMKLMEKLPTFSSPSTETVISFVAWAPPPSTVSRTV